MLMKLHLPVLVFCNVTATCHTNLVSILDNPTSTVMGVEHPEPAEGNRALMVIRPSQSLTRSSKDLVCLRLGHTSIYISVLTSRWEEILHRPELYSAA